MPTITIPQKLKEDNFIAVPSKEYEEFAQWRKVMRSFKVFTPTAAEKKDIQRAREDYKKGKYITFDELKFRLETKNKKRGL